MWKKEPLCLMNNQAHLTHLYIQTASSFESIFSEDTLLLHKRDNQNCFYDDKTMIALIRYMSLCISDCTACGLHISLPNLVGYINAASIYTLTDILREPTLHKRNWCAMKLAVMAIYNRVILWILCMLIFMRSKAFYTFTLVISQYHLKCGVYQSWHIPVTSLMSCIPGCFIPWCSVPLTRSMPSVFQLLFNWLSSHHRLYFYSHGQ